MSLWLSSAAVSRAQEPPPTPPVPEEAAVDSPPGEVPLWPDTFVSESNLTTVVARVREALGDDPASRSTSVASTASATPSLRSEGGLQEQPPRPSRLA